MRTLHATSCCRSQPQPRRRRARHAVSRRGSVVVDRVPCSALNECALPAVALRGPVVSASCSCSSTRITGGSGARGGLGTGIRPLQCLPLVEHRHRPTRFAGAMAGHDPLDARDSEPMAIRGGYRRKNSGLSRRQLRPSGLAASPATLAAASVADVADVAER